MQFDRILTKTVSRLARAGFGVRKTPDGPAPSAKSSSHDLRGSGSWANEWAGAKHAVQRAKTLASLGKSRKRGQGKAPSAVAQNIPEGTVRTKPLMSTRDVKLHQWISDRLEAEAPTCSLHAGVALGAFLVSDEAREDFDPLCSLVADLLITDDHGQPVVALIRENRANPARQLLLLDALLDADVPIVDIPARPSLSAMWAEIAANLPED
ncbi:MAG: hypothetical protein WBA67_15895 [Jannaschia sp.]